MVFLTKIKKEEKSWHFTDVGGGSKSLKIKYQTYGKYIDCNAKSTTFTPPNNKIGDKIIISVSSNNYARTINILSYKHITIDNNLALKPNNADSDHSNLYVIIATVAGKSPSITINCTKTGSVIGYNYVGLLIGLE